MSLLLIFPLIGTQYTFPANDDFSFEGGAEDAAQRYGSTWIGAWFRTYDYQMSNQGTYFYTFLIHLLRTFELWGIPGIHFMMFLLFFFFFFALWRECQERQKS